MVVNLDNGRCGDDEASHAARRSAGEQRAAGEGDRREEAIGERKRWRERERESVANHLHSIDGWYNEGNHSQPSSSTGSVGQRLFDAYRRTLCGIENGYVPGLACKEGMPYVELMESELLRRASSETQRQFYQEARIKIVAFLGCKMGEIEIGMRSATTVTMMIEMRNLFPDDFSQYYNQQSKYLIRELPPPPDQNWPSSSTSCSSLRSVGNSPEYSSLLMFNNMPQAIPEPFKEAQSTDQQAIRPTSMPIPPQPQLLIPPYHGLGFHFPNSEREDAAMTKAMLAVMSSPSSSSSSYPQPQLELQDRGGRSAFERYNNNASSSTASTQAHQNARMKAISHKPSMMKKVFALLQSMNLRRIEEQSMMRSRPPPTTSQLHHKISERKRREKLNESFQELKSMLPPCPKRDKASVLANTREYLSSLKREISELKQKNQELETRLSLSQARGIKTNVEEGNNVASPSRRVNVDIRQASESTSEEREVELRVTVRGGCDINDFLIKVLEFVKQLQNVSLASIEALIIPTHHNKEVIPLHQLGDEWDESAFEEAITRIVSDLAQP
ncbi:hypothetical protein Syun_026374 [Stephania yunnanensis]|uniref:BHLH domain-containing protein n=1 Tax=Stephania yunnanensis TaxID=152371 RepID=A0AAP0HWE6_9MAGN